MARRYRVLAFGVAGGLALAWLAGFAWFVGRLDEPPALPARADGIVALTGGADRIPAALRLLAQDRAGRLLISGVGGEVSLARLAHGTDIDLPALAPRITVGRSATSTTGNAEETRDWARRFAVRSLIVVTAAYHMERALTEIGRVLPEVRLYPMPVRPPAMREGGLGSLRLLAEQYTKFLAAELGLTRLAAGRRG